MHLNFLHCILVNCVMQPSVKQHKTLPPKCARRGAQHQMHSTARGMCAKRVHYRGMHAICQLKSVKVCQL